MFLVGEGGGEEKLLVPNPEFNGSTGGSGSGATTVKSTTAGGSTLGAGGSILTVPNKLRLIPGLPLPEAYGSPVPKPNGSPKLKAADI